MIPVLTIDGPSGAGKGTVSRALAKHLGWHYLDSGSLYRALAIACLNQKIALDDVKTMVEIANAMTLTFECNDELIVIMNGDNI
ncbi:MAG: (d)CMP kinase, partial [Methylococcales bacterium]|nr:(d)CMP kinase [Methylococcales bacterium]